MPDALGAPHVTEKGYTSKPGVQKITLDGPKVRLRKETKGEGGYWKDYKAVCLDNVYSGAFFPNNQDLIDGTNSQKLLHPMYCRLRWPCRNWEHI
jgi:hypothetical protein